MTDEEKIKLASQIAINFGIDFMDAKCRVEQACMNFGKEFNMSTETSDKNVATEEDIKILENYLKNSAYKQSNSDFFKNGGWEIVDLEVPQAIEHLLLDYTRQKQINEEHQKINGELREKVKELEKNIEKISESSSNNEELIEKLNSGETFTVNQLGFIKKNYIPKQKIKDKIEELKQDKESKYYDSFLEERDIEKTIEFLQELLQEEAKNEL